MILDEITVLAHELQQQDPGQGLELFRSLKRARDRHQNLVMIFQGSIGLHHALSDRTPVNELRTVAIGPLLHDDAVCLARCLILEQKFWSTTTSWLLKRSQRRPTASPFTYITSLKRRVAGGGTLTPSDVRDTIWSAITDPDDPWHFGHYEARLQNYYGVQPRDRWVSSRRDRARH
ncbi:MAG: hypothetical protein H6512_01670 [Acidimicrobiia bacterium]|nr:hypothetical protein [Acidimicrobiia bacterium]